ncbi:hypothetical protein HZ989_06015 [Brevundimonas sp. AJA228-03]|uniref:hypothetical protein n=1 Tax=Brevundimonas sp. AJA228-03 TaxID=2752515 RepID=UPI001ADEDDA9|nr:hypothetical protein [Brevundimonas sp. AJA228-03]QTN20606.1 hypothetical protein HZ989_06015 [Brevundimonas sp. AJA228-03]
MRDGSIAVALAVFALGACGRTTTEPRTGNATEAPVTVQAAKAVSEPDPTHCLIAVDEKVYLDAPCPVDDSDPTTITLNTGTISPPKVFVYLNTFEGVTEASWNGGEGASHAQAPLGAVTLSGRCWSNARARICRPA